MHPDDNSLKKDRLEVHKLTNGKDSDPKQVRKKIQFDKNTISDYDYRYKNDICTPRKNFQDYLLPNTLTFDINEPPNSIQFSLKTILHNYRCKQNSKS